MSAITVYLVEDCKYSPGRILAVFYHQEDAEQFAVTTYVEHKSLVVPRTLWESQPPVKGYNL